MRLPDPQQEYWKQQAAEAAAQLIEDGMVIGLGSGSTATLVAHALARRIQAGLHLVGAIPTSKAMQHLAAALGIPLTTLDTHPALDLDLDGADEIDAQLSLLKGGGGALLREKIVASVSRRFIVVADQSKRVTKLGERFPLPVEVVPFAAHPVRTRLEDLGATVTLRHQAGSVFVTDNSNVILDCRFSPPIEDSEALDVKIHQMVGVVETGFFFHLAQQAVIGGPQGVQRFPRFRVEG
jgi:ribose 5-phosphate isomerase A